MGGGAGRGLERPPANPLWIRHWEVKIYRDNLQTN